MTNHPKGKLSRQELSWLLTQEAQGAADRLRKGVQVLMTNLPPPQSGGDAGVDQTLDALDDAMRMLSTIHQHPVVGKGRRGRIDLASLLWEMAPDARVSLEPGIGTEVFGDEAELRRMIHVLVGPGSRAGSSVMLKREGDEVRLSVTMGPDSSVTSDAERAWLNRMAIRYGGRYELEGGMEVLTLPADDSTERAERDALRKELDEARRQGEAYARELAAIFSQTEEMGGTPSSQPPSAFPVTDRFVTVARIVSAIASEMRNLLSPVSWDLMALRSSTGGSFGVGDGHDERLEAIQRRLILVQDFLGGLGAVGELDAAEGSTEVDLHEVVRTVVKGLGARADRHGVAIRVSDEGEASEGRVVVRAPARIVSVLVRELVSSAIDATPRDQSVRVAVAVEGRTTYGNPAVRLTVEDGGAPIPAHALRAFLALELEPGTYGRPSSLSLHLCQVMAQYLSASFALEDLSPKGLRAVVTFPK